MTLFALEEFRRRLASERVETAKRHVELIEGAYALQQRGADDLARVLVDAHRVLQAAQDELEALGPDPAAHPHLKR